jgi:protein associated with RNAse G/E
MKKIQVSKQDENGHETWHYEGQLIKRGPNYLVIEAFFDRKDTRIDGLVLAKGDRFVETYYTDRWYNVFEIHAREDDHLRGWYCNIGFPAELVSDTLSYKDLALDLLVFPDGRQVVLDQEEFESLDIPASIRHSAETALAELQAKFSARGTGFKRS